jgi:hypothetical protein
MNIQCSTNATDEICIQNSFHKPQGKDYLKTLDVEGEILLKWLLKMTSGRGLTSSGLGQDPVSGSCETAMKVLVKQNVSFSRTLLHAVM